MPVQLLVRCNWRVEPGREKLPGVSATTLGLDSLGLPEIKQSPSQENPVALRNRLLNLAAYLIVNGPVFRDGDTIGIDERSQARVRHGHDDSGKAILILE